MKVCKTTNGYCINYGEAAPTVREAFEKHRQWLAKQLAEAEKILNSTAPENSEKFFKDGEHFGITELFVNPPQDSGFDTMMQNLWPKN